MNTFFKGYCMKNICPACHTQIKSDARVCPHCNLDYPCDIYFIDKYSFYLWETKFKSSCQFYNRSSYTNQKTSYFTNDDNRTVHNSSDNNQQKLSNNTFDKAQKRFTKIITDIVEICFTVLILGILVFLAIFLVASFRSCLHLY